jgi:hypothetical protein
LTPSIGPVDFHSVKDFAPAQLKKFDSGNEELTKYFHRFARKNDKTGLSPCTVMAPKGQVEPILGYATVSNSTVEKGDPPAPPLSDFPNYPISVTLIGRLAINKDHHRQGLGKLFLMHIFFNSAHAVRKLKIGSVGIITDGIDQGAVDFYSKYDFELLPGQNDFPKRMFISNQTLFDAVDG